MRFKLIYIFPLLILLAGCAQQVVEKDIITNGDHAKTPLTENSNYKGEILAGTTTPYITFNKEDYEEAIKENKVILLYFYANWCPICKAEQRETFVAFNEMNYDNVIGFRVNYRDNEVDADEEQLAKEHGITYQHTKVIIKNGERVLKSPDSWKKEKYLEEINKIV